MERGSEMNGQVQHSSSRGSRDISMDHSGKTNQ